MYDLIYSTDAREGRRREAEGEKEKLIEQIENGNPLQYSCLETIMIFKFCCKSSRAPTIV